MFSDTIFITPMSASISTTSQFFKILLAFLVPRIQGIPSSLETIAAWLVSHHSSVIIAAARYMAGNISGLVIDETRISPFCILCTSCIFNIILTLPIAFHLDATVPDSALVAVVSVNSLCVATASSQTNSVYVSIFVIINSIPSLTRFISVSSDIFLVRIFLYSG